MPETATAAINAYKKCTSMEMKCFIIILVIEREALFDQHLSISLQLRSVYAPVVVPTWQYI